MSRIADRRNTPSESIHWDRNVKIGQIVAFRDIDAHEPFVRERVNIRGRETPSPQSVFDRLYNIIFQKKNGSTEGYIQVQVLDPGEKDISNFVKIVNDLELYREDLERHTLKEAKLNKKLDEKFNSLMKSVKHKVKHNK